jgi:hypothetical protein
MWLTNGDPPSSWILQCLQLKVTNVCVLSAIFFYFYLQSNSIHNTVCLSVCLSVPRFVCAPNMHIAPQLQLDIRACFCKGNSIHTVVCLSVICSQFLKSTIQLFSGTICCVLPIPRNLNWRPLPNLYCQPYFRISCSSLRELWSDQSVWSTGSPQTPARFSCLFTLEKRKLQAVFGHVMLISGGNLGPHS